MSIDLEAIEQKQTNGLWHSVELNLANQVSVELAKAGHMSASQVEYLKIRAVVDASSMRLVLPQSAVDQLHVPLAGSFLTKFNAGSPTLRNRVEMVRLELQGRSGVFSAVVEPDWDEARIGAMVLNELDLVLDPQTGRLLPRNPQGVTAEMTSTEPSVGAVSEEDETSNLADVLAKAQQVVYASGSPAKALEIVNLLSEEEFEKRVLAEAEWVLNEHHEVLERLAK